MKKTAIIALILLALLLFLPLICASQDFDFFTHTEVHYLKGQPAHINNNHIHKVERDGAKFIVRDTDGNVRSLIEAHRIGTAEGNPSVWIYESIDGRMTVYVNPNAHALQVIAREKERTYVAAYGPLMFRDAPPAVSHQFQTP